MSQKPISPARSLVPGAARGLGAGTAAAVAEACYDIVSLDLDAPARNDRSTGGASSVSDEGAVATPVAAVAGRVGWIDDTVSCTEIADSLWLERTTVA